MDHVALNSQNHPAWLITSVPGISQKIINILSNFVKLFRLHHFHFFISFFLTNFTYFVGMQATQVLMNLDSQSTRGGTLASQLKLEMLSLITSMLSPTIKICWLSTNVILISRYVAMLAASNICLNTA